MDDNVEIELLPTDLAVELFSRLPAKFIGRIRTLSKYWNTFLSTTDFVNQHIAARLKTNQENVMLKISGENGFNYFYAISRPMTDEESTTLIPIDHNVHHEWGAMCIDGSCNGFILVTNASYYLEGLCMLLVNPTTREIVDLPKFSYPPLRRPVPNYNTGAGFGFGYDSVTKDYKVVRLYGGCKPAETGSEYPEERYVHVYSVKRGGAVRRVDNSGFGELFEAYNHDSPGAFANGSLHWLVGKSYTKYTSIGAFDLNVERFSLIGLPVEFDNTDIGLFTCGMNVHGGCLCVLNNFGEGGIYVWVRKEYNVAESWVKLRIHQPNNIEIGPRLYTLCSVGDHKLLCITHWLDLFMTSFKEGTSQTVAFHELPNIEDAYHYIDTLVSLKNHMSAKHYKEMAELYVEQRKMRQASLCYKIAADLYQSKANQCRRKFSQIRNLPDFEDEE